MWVKCAEYCSSPGAWVDGVDAGVDELFNDMAKGKGTMGSRDRRIEMILRMASFGVSRCALVQGVTDVSDGKCTKGF